ncbi:hypothetical protein Flexsi_0867 [Flexistipes sinusarabici DSM 4947]|uniref:Uncharacterized protein n=1 Tax=Flexistipes sinusarabici (strain ATCC 49648 / DSM 4947 / MAS 10) TaxID=717231 RepID=F8E4W1_FLESM|nr:recombination protein O N-terminal domain-containing protein [Flexistipes sinusarabici]AEI14531.1 hypothetical protein Flexsi_0867 [Flexistipes sinusarabici DSM 4947]
MKRIKTPAIIYKMMMYSDKSAISTAFSLSHGKIKLFINKAYSKRGGISKMLPGDLDFLKKSSSDLNKFYAFYQNIGMSHFLESPAVYLRMNLIFEIFDMFYGLDMPDERLWRLLMNVTPHNFRKSSIYISDYILNESGFRDNFIFCSSCDKHMVEGFLEDGRVFCMDCSKGNGFYIDEKLVEIFNALDDNELYKKLFVISDVEMMYWDFFQKYFNKITGKKLKTLDTLKLIE